MQEKFRVKANERIALIAGATGLIGRYLLRLLLADRRYKHVNALVRKAAFPDDNKLSECIVDFDRLPALPAASDVYCCLGTTLRKAGSQAAFRKVDFDCVVNLAAAAKRGGCKRFLVVSAIGANAKSAVFYSRVKGEMENALREIHFDALHVFQPSFLTGDRQESRAGESLGIAAFSAMAPLMLGPLRKYRPIAAQAVAQAMVNAAGQDSRGVAVYDSARICTLAG